MKIVDKEGKPLTDTQSRSEKRELKKKVVKAIANTDDFLLFMYKEGKGDNSDATSSARMGEALNIVSAMLDQFYKNGNIANLMSMFIGNLYMRDPEIIEQIKNMTKTKANE